MLNDKRLAAAVTTAAKNGSLSYRDRGQNLDMIGEGWAISVWKDYAKKELRKTLAVFVEMLGEIPEKCCLEIRKTKEGFYAQEADEEVFSEEMSVLMLCSGPEECRLTPLSIGGKRMLQIFDGRIAAVTGTVLGIAGAAENPPLVNEGFDRVRWVETYWELAAVAMRPRDDPEESRIAAIWQALEALELVEWPIGHTEEKADGQMEMREVVADENTEE